MRAARWSAAAIAAVVIAAPVLAGAVSGRQKDVVAAPMAYFEQFVPANVGYTFETRNLVPSTADTVIHVQDGNDPNGGFVAGNDDFMGLASRVVIAPVASDRFLQIIVRAYGSTSGGTAQLVRTATTGAAARVRSPARDQVTPSIENPPATGASTWATSDGEAAALFGNADFAANAAREPVDSAVSARSARGTVGTASSCTVGATPVSPVAETMVVAAATRPGPATVRTSLLGVAAANSTWADAISTRLRASTAVVRAGRVRRAPIGSRTRIYDSWLCRPHRASRD